MRLQPVLRKVVAACSATTAGSTAFGPRGSQVVEGTAHRLLQRHHEVSGSAPQCQRLRQHVAGRRDRTETTRREAGDPRPASIVPLLELHTRRSLNVYSDHRSTPSSFRRRTFDLGRVRFVSHQPSTRRRPRCLRPVEDVGVGSACRVERHVHTFDALAAAEVFAMP